MWHARETIARCWECEATTDRPTSVTLRPEAGRIGPLTLCPPCHQTHYLPLARIGSEMLDVAPAATAGSAQ